MTPPPTSPAAADSAGLKPPDSLFVAAVAGPRSGKSREDAITDAENAVWDQVVQACSKAWKETPSWSQSPTELITRIINERDDALSAIPAPSKYETAAEEEEALARILARADEIVWENLPDTEAQALKALRDGDTASGACKTDYRRMAIAAMDFYGPHAIPAPQMQAGEHDAGLTQKELTLGACPPGLFLFDATVGFKSEYKTESKSRAGFWQSDAYCVESGEYFWGGTPNPIEREQLMVLPLPNVVTAIETLGRELATATEYAEAAAATLEDEQAAHQDTLRLWKAAEAQVATMRARLNEAAGWFRDYERMHREKGTADGVAKAMVNGDRAATLEQAALSTSAPDKTEG